VPLDRLRAEDDLERVASASPPIPRCGKAEERPLILREHRRTPNIRQRLANVLGEDVVADAERSCPKQVEYFATFPSTATAAVISRMSPVALAERITEHEAVRRWRYQRLQDAGTRPRTLSC
jgi:hypothetical protein